MVVKDLKVDFSSIHPHAKILGRRELLSKELEGNWATSFKGKGMEFSGYRIYSSTDDASHIDWRASIRAKSLLVREFEEFKNFNVVFVLDVSDSMLFTSCDKLKAEYGAELVYVLSKAASNAGEAVGLALISDRLVTSIQPNFGRDVRKHFELVLGDGHNYGGILNFKKSILQLHSVIGPRSILIIVSDFLGFSGDWEKYLSLLAVKHDLIGVIIRDKRDFNLPVEGIQLVAKDPSSTNTLLIDSKLFSKQYSEIASKQELYIRGVFKKLRGRCLVIENCDDFSRSIGRFFRDGRIKN